MRLIHTSLFAAIAALGLAACNQQPATPQTETPPAAPADGATTGPAATRNRLRHRRRCFGNGRAGTDPGQRDQGQRHLQGG